MKVGKRLGSSIETPYGPLQMEKGDKGSTMIRMGVSG